MKVIFFSVDGVLNYPESEARTPSGRLGVAESSLKDFRSLVKESEARVVLIGSWTKDWDFDDTKCTSDGLYLNKKLGRKGLHILDKTEGVDAWLSRHPNVTDYTVLSSLENVKWEEL